VGDIERSPRVAAAVAETGLVGIGYVELFGLGPPWDTPALAAIAETGSDPIFEVGAEKGSGAGKGSDPLFEVGWQPHAPYSAGPGLFAAAARSGRPVCTHLAETVAEHRFVAEATGPYRELLERIGKWDAANASAYRGGLSPVQWMRPYLEQAPWLLAHCNYVDDADIALLAETGASVAYCPIASEYFGHTGHRYRDMLAAGVNVCLGTDSIVCQPAGEPQPLGILPQMRRLHERDDAAPDLLLQMATVNAARALQLPAAAATLAPGAPAALASARIDPADATDPLAQAMRRRAALEPVEL
jgi:cytosine/adenosine deaminase-related metal-dependent hydrolase